MNKLVIFFILLSSQAFADNSFNNKGLVCQEFNNDELVIKLEFDTERIWCENNKCFMPQIKDYEVVWELGTKKIEFSGSDKIFFYFYDHYHMLDRETLKLTYMTNSYNCKVKKSKKEVAQDLYEIIKESKKNNKF